jgi:hypothetical protein
MLQKIKIIFKFGVTSISVWRHTNIGWCGDSFKLFKCKFVKRLYGVATLGEKHPGSVYAEATLV